MNHFEAKNVSVNGTVEVSATYEGDPSVGIPMGWEMEWVCDIGNIRVVGTIDNREWDKHCGLWPITDADLLINDDGKFVFLCGIAEARYGPDRQLLVKDIPLVYDEVQNVMNMIRDAEEDERKAEDEFFQQSGGYSEADDD